MVRRVSLPNGARQLRPHLLHPVPVLVPVDRLPLVEFRMVMMTRRLSYEAQAFTLYRPGCGGDACCCMVICSAATSTAADAGSTCSGCRCPVEVPRLPGRVGCLLPI